MNKLLMAAVAFALVTAFAGYSHDGGSKSDSVNIATVKVTGAEFTGSLENELWDYEGAFTAARSIKINDFYIGKYEVTKDEYKAVMKGNKLGLNADPSCSSSDPAKYKITAGEIDGKRAVENVTWFDAVYFCNLLSEKDGLTSAYKIENPVVSDGHITDATVEPVAGADGWRLPTEIEWEYAARGGDTKSAAWKYKYSGVDSSLTSDEISDTALDAAGWYWYNTASGTTADDDPESGTPGYGTHQVGKKAPNTLGICDMSGNVWEWCYDWYSNIGPTTPLAGPSEGSYRIWRGGSWGDDANIACVAFRLNDIPDFRFINLGFRVVRSAQ
ncbi:formylglycine-generating enzyme family protein [Treponema sp.]|uniref:formylglycine-generating enzyme family protein n=1 Tax=Treponema sp. TaxID=166 RepID=UPI0038909F9A